MYMVGDVKFQIKILAELKIFACYVDEALESSDKIDREIAVKW